jgi:hypothetical protein
VFLGAIRERVRVMGSSGLWGSSGSSRRGFWRGQDLGNGSRCLLAKCRWSGAESAGSGLRLPSRRVNRRSKSGEGPGGEHLLRERQDVSLDLDHAARLGSARSGRRPGRRSRDHTGRRACARGAAELTQRPFLALAAPLREWRAVEPLAAQRRANLPRPRAPASRRDTQFVLACGAAPARPPASLVAVLKISALLRPRPQVL